MFMFVFSLNYLSKMTLQSLLIQILMGASIYLVLNKLFNTFLWTEGVLIWKKMRTKKSN